MLLVQGFIYFNSKKISNEKFTGSSYYGTESSIKRTRHLPVAVQAAWKNSGYSDWYVHNIRKIETPEQQLYVLHLNNGTLLDANKYDAFKEDHVLYFTREGALVRAERI